MTDQQKIDAVITAAKAFNDAVLQAPDGYLLKMTTTTHALSDAVKTDGEWNCSVPELKVSFFKHVASSQGSS